VFSVYEEARGTDDDDLIQKAFVEHWILITNDKDFGEKVFRDNVRTGVLCFFALRMNGLPIKLR
jgi:hypothetical protein